MPRVISLHQCPDQQVLDGDGRNAIPRPIGTGGETEQQPRSGTVSSAAMVFGVGALAMVNIADFTALDGETMQHVRRALAFWLSAHWSEVDVGAVPSFRGLSHRSRLSSGNR
jgi:hypothetical protein